MAASGVVGLANAARSGGDRRSRLPVHAAWLLALIEAEADLTLAAVAARLLAEHGVTAGAGMLSRFFTSRGISWAPPITLA